VSAVLILAAVCLIAPTTARAQPGFPVSVSAGAHSLTVPWHPGPVAARYNPAVVVGAERTLRPGGRVRLYQTANVGFVRHYWWMTGVFVDSEVGASRALPFGLHVDLRLGLGYMHYFWRRETLTLEDGEYVSSRDWGRPSLLVPISLIVGRHGRPGSGPAVAPFVSVRWAAQALFLDEVPLTTHLMLLAGVRLEWGSGPRFEGGRP
jgi:hypothetical protein